MKCYTMQKLKSWEEAKAKGYLTGDIKFIDEDFLPSYKWMMNQMKKRIKILFWTSKRIIIISIS